MGHRHDNRILFMISEFMPSNIYSTLTSSYQLIQSLPTKVIPSSNLHAIPALLSILMIIRNINSYNYSYDDTGYSSV